MLTPTADSACWRERRRVMAHGVWLTDEESFVAGKCRECPCPSPISIWLPGLPRQKDLEAGEMSVWNRRSGGSSLSMFRAVTDAIQVSKLRWRCVDQTQKPLTLEEAFYLATLGGGRFFGKVGSLACGYEADFLVLDDSSFPDSAGLDVRGRLERLLYLGDEKNIIRKFVPAGSGFVGITGSYEILRLSAVLCGRQSVHRLYKRPAEKAPCP